MMKKEILFVIFLCGFCVNSMAQFWQTSEPKRLPGSVNTATFEEIMPVFSKDSSLLYFVRAFDPSSVAGESDQDIWFSKRAADGSYSSCQPLSDLNNKYNNGIVGISAKGKSIYVLNSYDGKKDLVKGLSMSVSNGNKWGTPTKIMIPSLDIEGDFYTFFVTESEDVVIISYKGPNSLGEEDLYVSTKSGGQWSAPVHMGSALNTKGFETTPFLTKGLDTLFFSSNGFEGFGDADIYYSVRQGDSYTNWSAPVNLGNKVNSAKFDAYFSYSGNTMYWSSNRDGERSDIYMASILTPPALSLRCTGTDASTFGGVDGTLSSTVAGGVAPMTYAWSNGASIQNPVGVGKGTYVINVTDAIGQKVSCIAKVGEPVPVQDLSFKHVYDYNYANLTCAENESLGSFVKQVEAQLKNGRSSIKIMITSSASTVPTKAFEGSNQKLADARAERMKKELESYFATAGLSAKVSIVIESTKVQGPKYRSDFEDQGKYREFQFVELKTQ
jgi:hypothetical protein